MISIRYYIFLAPHYKQLSANKKCSIIKLCRWHGLKKLVLILWVYIFIFVENWILYYTRRSFFVWMRTGSNPQDINRFRMNTRKYFQNVCSFLCCCDCQIKWFLNCWFQRRLGTMYKNIIHQYLCLYLCSQALI